MVGCCRKDIQYTACVNCTLEVNKTHSVRLPHCYDKTKESSSEHTPLDILEHKREENVQWRLLDM